MNFSEWLLLSEKAERTSGKAPLYPEMYHTKQYVPLYHAPYIADYAYWLHSKLEPHTWDNYQSVFRSDEPPEPTWEKITFPAHAHHRAEGKDFNWSLPD
jgi:hypothetical protein